MIDPVFDAFSEGLPPDWEERKDAVHSRDENICQVTGCIRSHPLDVHHKIPLSVTPDHRISNLVSLCRFHHQMVHTHRIEQDFDAHYAFVAQHWNNGTFVERTIRRFERISSGEIIPLFTKLHEHYGIACSTCGARDWRVEVMLEEMNRISVVCVSCQQAWLYERGLVEEFVVQLTQTAMKTEVKGSFDLPMAKLCLREPVKPYLCVQCGGEPERISFLKKVESANGRFLGCEEWRPNNPYHDRKRWSAGDENRIW